jgi:heme-degrading monooxygenase HmoA
MIEVIYEFVTNLGAGGRFELAFGPGGAWSKLFSGSPGFRGTTLLRDTNDPQRYLIVDLWDSEAAREQAVAEHQDATLALAAELEAWVASEQDLGTFRIVNSATVRPRPSSPRRGGAR